jgi:hypothetical protein
MQQRFTRLILAGAATFTFGLGASALSSHHSDEVSLPAMTKAAAVTDLTAHQKTPVRLTSAMAKKAEKAKRKAAPRAKAAQPSVLFKNQTLGSYFWDTGSSGNGDTGAPASGMPMQEGCFASPSWPMGTKGYIEYQGKKAAFTICDRGPGTPSRSGVMLDIDGITFAKLTGGTWNEPYVVGGSGEANGHIPVTYYVTHWGDGPGKGAPQPL